MAVFIAIMSVLLPVLEETKGKSCPPNTDLRSVLPSADWSLCFLEGSVARSVAEGKLLPEELAQVKT